MGICGNVQDKSKKEKEKDFEHILNNQKEEIKKMKELYQQQINNLEEEIKKQYLEKKQLEEENKNSNQIKIKTLLKEIQFKVEEKKQKQQALEKLLKLNSELETQKDINIIKNIHLQAIEILKKYRVNNEEFINNKEENEEIKQDQKEFFENLNDSNHISGDIEEEMKYLEEDYKAENLPSANKGKVNINNQIYNQNNNEEIIAN